MPSYLVPSPIFHPLVKQSASCCRFESPNDSEFIAQNSVFYRPDHVSDWSIRHHVADISGNIISHLSRRFVHSFLTQLIYTFNIWSLVWQVLVPPSSHHPIVPLSRHSFVLSSLRPVFLSSLHPGGPLSRRPFVPSAVVVYHSAPCSQCMDVARTGYSGRPVSRAT